MPRAACVSTMTTSDKMPTMTRGETRQLFVSQLDVNLATAAEIARNSKMPNNLDADAHLQAGNALKPSWILGTGVVYERPAEKFKDRVTSDGLTFMVPQKYQGLRDTLLVFQRGFEINRKTGLFTGEVTHVLENFPANNGWYATDSETGLPCGRILPVNDTHARHLWRKEGVNGTYIGDTTRGSDFSYENGRGIDLSVRHGQSLLMAQFDPILVGSAHPSPEAETTITVKGYTTEQIRPLLRRAVDSLYGLAGPVSEGGEVVRLLQALLRASEQKE